MISHFRYFEFGLASRRYALARPPLFGGEPSRGAWFESIRAPASGGSDASSWQELPPVFARDVLARAGQELRGAQRSELFAWLSRRAEAHDASARGREERLLSDAGAELDQELLVMFERAETPLSAWAPPPAPEVPLLRLGPEPQRFAVRWVDEVGQGIAGLPLEFEHAGGSERQSTDPVGIGSLRTTSSSASVRVADEAKLRDLMKGRWSKPGAAQPWLTERDARVIPLREERLPTIELSPDSARLVSVQPYVARVRLLGGFFDTSKCFILPSGLPAIRAVVGMYGQHANAKLLIVGHTDTAGKPDYNDTLSLERARALKDYLTDSVDGWLAWYGDDVASEKRWGAAEDRLMIDAMPDAAARAKSEHPVRWFQRTRGLTVDGIAGPETRRALVTDYMALDGTSLPEGIEASVHGCGENFPQKATGDGKAEPENRRVEVFFFPGWLGVQPAAPGDNSKPGSREYPEWEKRSRRTEDHGLGAGFKVKLVSSDGHPIPEAAFEVRFADGSTQQGRLDSQGTALVSGPKGPYTIEYLDHDAIRAKALAARAHQAIQEANTARLLGVLAQPAEELARVSDAYDTYFNTSGKGLAADSREALGEGEDGDAGDHLLAASGIEPEQSTVVVAYADPSQTPAGDGASGEEGGVLA